MEFPVGTERERSLLENLKIQAQCKMCMCVCTMHSYCTYNTVSLSVLYYGHTCNVPADPQGNGNGIFGTGKSDCPFEIELNIVLVYIIGYCVHTWQLTDTTGCMSRVVVIIDPK